MAQFYATVRSVPQPFAVHGLSSTTTVLQTIAVITVIWQDASTDPWPIGTPVLPAATYGGTTVDTTLLAWLIVAVKGIGLRLVKEKDASTMDATLGGSPQWAILRRMADGLPPYVIPQI